MFDDLDDYNYIYMSNPFSDDDIMRNLLRNIKKSFERKYREIHIIYNNPTQERIILEEQFQVERRMPVFFNTRVVIYVLN